MEEVIEKKVEEIKKYKTSDGKIHDRKDRAELHEQYLIAKEKVDKLKRVDGAYYCETQEDFDAIVDKHAYAFPIWDYKTESGYIPNSHYNKKEFNGADWYFFECERRDEDADRYWVESLSEKKAEWDEFYSQFTIKG